MVDGVIKDKVAKGLWRPHPELATSVKHTQYWCLTVTSLTDSKCLNESLGIEGSTEVDPKMAMQLIAPFTDVQPPGLAMAGYESLRTVGAACGSGGDTLGIGCCCIAADAAAGAATDSAAIAAAAAAGHAACSCVAHACESTQQ